MEAHMDVGNQIKERRQRLGLSQEELAQRLYVSRVTVSHWETSDRKDVNELPKEVENIVPHGVIPVYCEGMFPKRLGTILDFMHVYDEDMANFGDKIEWLPQPDARLANELTVR